MENDNDQVLSNFFNENNKTKQNKQFWLAAGPLTWNEYK
jgi:hypothetical protein